MYLKRPSSACKESYSRMRTLSLGVQRGLKKAKESMQESHSRMRTLSLGVHQDPLACSRMLTYAACVARWASGSPRKTRLDVC